MKLNRKTSDILRTKKSSKEKNLTLDNCRLKSIPEEVRGFVKLRNLSLFNNQINELPDFISDLKHLISLNLSNNEIIIFPENLKGNTYVKYLYLKENKVNHLVGLETMVNLEKLYLSSNKLLSLGVDFSNLLKLKEVDVSNNLITKFPKSLLIDSIKILNISNNEIKSIPSEIKQLKKITKLDISNNNISELPDEICELSELRELNLSGNKISILPKGFNKLKKLTKLTIAGNPIGEPPIEIRNQGLSAVLNYYIHLGNSVKLNEAKLLIVGEGGVGKTFLLNRLVLKQTIDTITTEGIDIKKWNVHCNNGDGFDRNIRLNVWDFGGQEIYHSTHQFFLTKRSIYLFVWDARHSNNEILSFDYWLNIIKILSSNSPVIIVHNKIDERIKKIDEKGVKETFPNILSFINVSAKTGENIDKLEKEIRENVLNLPHIGDNLPEVWSQVREKLDSMSENYIKYERYLQICNSFGLDKKESKHLSQYFHDLGVFIHFSDNTILKSVVFLKPEWVTNNVYKIFDIKDIVSNYGKFNHDLLENELVDYDSEKMIYIIELMKKFELCFELANSSFIIPELLNQEKPDTNIKVEDSISMMYQYYFMPAGIITRLIVRLNESLYEDLYWKNGVYLKLKNTFAEVISNQFKRSIKISVTGEDKVVLLGIIKRELELINKSLNNPSHKIKIQCNCNQCESIDNPYMFDFSSLEKAKQKKTMKVQCQESFLMVKLEELIGPYANIDQFQSNKGFNNDDLAQHLIDIISRLLERKYIHRIEDLVTDSFTDQLRAIGYITTDQTRSGRSKVSSGELDIMIRNEQQTPLAILEAMNLNSCGPKNNEIIEHLNKLLLNYDTNGLQRNYMLIYSRVENFDKLIKQYEEYFKMLPEHNLYDKSAKLIGFESLKPHSLPRNIKMFKSSHSLHNGFSEIYHFVINFHK